MRTASIALVGAILLASCAGSDGASTLVTTAAPVATSAPDVTATPAVTDPPVTEAPAATLSRDAEVTVRRCLDDAESASNTLSVIAGGAGTDADLFIIAGDDLDTAADSCAEAQLQVDTEDAAPFQIRKTLPEVVATLAYVNAQVAIARLDPSVWDPSIPDGFVVALADYKTAVNETL